MTSSISVIVPVYNGERTLPELVRRLGPVLATLTREHELVLVNDGSRDHSWAMIQQLAAVNRWVRGINLMRNFGQHNALLCGIRAARYEMLVTMDDDLQHAPEDIPRLIEELQRGTDVVYGKPEREQHSLWRNLASRATKLAMERMIGATRARDISSFRAFRTDLRDGFARFQSPFVSIDVLLTWSTPRFTAIAVPRKPRELGQSNYNAWKLLVATVNVVTAFSTLPLRVATMLGFCMALFGSGVMAFVLGHYLLRGSMPGFPFLVSLITILSGAQLLALGTMGEYLGRIFVRSMGRPAYAVREVSGLVPPATAETPSPDDGEPFTFDDDNLAVLGWYGRRIVRALAAKSCRSVLSLGIGHRILPKAICGRLGSGLSRYAIVEGSREVLEAFRAWTVVPPGVELIHSSFEDYRPGETFDAIEMGFVLEHVGDPEAVVRQFAQYVNPGGTVFIAVPNARSLHRLIGHEAGLLDHLYRLSPEDLQRGHQRYFDVESLRKLVLGAGLHIVNVEGIFLKPLTSGQFRSLNLAPSVLEGFLKVGVAYPELCNVIFMEATR